MTICDSCGDVGKLKRADFEALLKTLWPIVEKAHKARGKIRFDGSKLKRRPPPPLDPGALRSEIEYAVSWFAVEKWMVANAPAPRPSHYAPNVPLRLLVGYLADAWLRLTGDMVTLGDNPSTDFIFKTVGALGDKTSSVPAITRLIKKELLDNGLQIGWLGDEVRQRAETLKTPAKKGKRTVKGRPPTGNALSPAERQRAYRIRLKAAQNALR